MIPEPESLANLASEMIAMLESLEFSHPPEESANADCVCPTCFEDSTVGHFAGCPLHDLLTRARGIIPCAS